MKDVIFADLCVIGAGAAGLSVAAGAAQLGVNVVLVEANEMGGDCLNTGCVPSKALLHVGHIAYQASKGAALGISGLSPKSNYAAAMSYVQSVIEGIAPIDSVERFQNLGVHVIKARAQFIGPDQIQAGDNIVQAKRFVIATGARASVPPIKGLSDLPYLTNETLFKGKAKPGHLLILGGGAVGLEMAQAHIRLGAKVTLIERDVCLPTEDRDMVAPILDQLRAEGVTILEKCYVKSAEMVGRKVVLKTSKLDITGSHVLVATGRKPNTETLGLEQANVVLDNGFVETDARLRSSNKRIYALGDVVRGAGSTHGASYQAGIVIRNALFRLPAKQSLALMPRAVYTSPEYARVGLNESEAVRENIKYRVARWPFEENDRARAESGTAGHVKVIITPGGKILGAAITGTMAADLLTPWSLAMSNKLKLSAMAGVIVPYPTRSEAGKRAAGDFYGRKLFSARGRMVVKIINMLLP